MGGSDRLVGVALLWTFSPDIARFVSVPTPFLSDDLVTERLEAFSVSLPVLALTLLLGAALAVLRWATFALCSRAVTTLDGLASLLLELLLLWRTSGLYTSTTFRPTVDLPGLLLLFTWYTGTDRLVTRSISLLGGPDT